MKRIAHVFLALALAGCHPHADDAAEEPAAAPPVDSDVYTAAVASPERTDADRARDAGRKPAQVLEFFRITPGMTVLDMFSGGGYYTEILASVVGGDGRVVAHSNQAYMGFVGDEFEARYADNRLPNVEILMAENNELALDAERFDAILVILAYQDIYWVAPERGWSKIEVPKLHTELYKSLKPGGVLGVVDHYADAGSPRETGGTLHRIDPGIVIAELESAGFVLDDKSDLLRNMEDDHSKGVFDPSIRGNTDRFVLRFKKP